MNSHSSHLARRKREPDMDWVADVPRGCLCHWANLREDDGWYLVDIAEGCLMHPTKLPEVKP